MELKVLDEYKEYLSLMETEIAIKRIKDYFEVALSQKLNLTRVSAPLFVEKSTGLNDYLNGIERTVSFDALDVDGEKLEIVQSLAKWKRYALKRYGFRPGEGLYTDMNAIRRDEKLDPIHSIYVDQWDWEKIILKEQRTVRTLKQIVTDIYSVFKQTELYVYSLYPHIKPILPKKITFITSQELEDMYPSLTPKEREYKAAKKYGAFFLMQIGDILKSGKKHDGRSPDYDDWKLNGDIIFYYPVLDCALELSSMGIRVDKDSLIEQVKKCGCTERLKWPFHQMVLNEELPFTVGGGIGQSRICMFFLRKMHIGEVQSSVWPKEVLQECNRMGITLL
ncbi:aspartate-ammonia ligase [Alkalithermobacter thermoalcaliphilus JW-YL-7 = DSM 7308]|uniref:Aspartate--ammonia ligase n=1 Tax=Alkalithermobacter thermoalcaliphilus JW-YL-7 = DSM 7308 TaxID=1121328 RepID=A0A150FRK3_CLOPD|nr:Aspartate--ammonia ligase [[Clostridium] paradoxum JW-YL-7 = DSM 7308]SHK41311.1 aspartate-ammonia ligase [[Clostridium] paradoxum JW-YL-7 = DSM 7308]